MAPTTDLLSQLNIKNTTSSQDQTQTLSHHMKQVLVLLLEARPSAPLHYLAEYFTHASNADHDLAKAYLLVKLMRTSSGFCEDEIRENEKDKLHEAYTYLCRAPNVSVTTCFEAKERDLHNAPSYGASPGRDTMTRRDQKLIFGAHNSNIPISVLNENEKKQQEKQNQMNQNQKSSNEKDKNPQNLPPVAAYASDVAEFLKLLLKDYPETAQEMIIEQFCGSTSTELFNSMLEIGARFPELKNVC